MSFFLIHYCFFFLKRGFFKKHFNCIPWSEPYLAQNFGFLTLHFYQNLWPKF